MARPRNYAAEYRARQQRSQEKYGISYNQQRGIRNLGRKAGRQPDSIERALFAIKAGHTDIKTVRERLKAGGLTPEERLQMLLEADDPFELLWLLDDEEALFDY